MRNINVIIRGNYASLRTSLRGASAEVKQFGADAKRVAEDTGVHTRRIRVAFVAAGAIIAAAFAGSIIKATEFEQSLRNVTTISSYVEKNFDKTASSLIEMSNRLPQSANTLAQGLYDVASSGFAGADGLYVTEVAAKAASAGLSDTATAGRAITGVLNAYGFGADKAREVSDVLFQTVNLGVVTFSDLAQNIGDVIGMASAARVPIEDVGTAIATITLAGVPAA